MHKMKDLESMRIAIEITVERPQAAMYILSKPIATRTIRLIALAMPMKMSKEKTMDQLRK